MMLSPFGTLSRYFARQFLFSFLGLVGVMAVVIFPFEFVELARRATGVDLADTETVFRMALFKLPNTLEILFPFMILFSAMFTFWRLTRSQELIVTRATGISAWQFLLPAVVVALLIGMAKITVVNPVTAVLFARYDQMRQQYIYGQTEVLDVGKGGMWLRQRNGDEFIVIFGERVVPGTLSLEGVTVFRFDEDETYLGRVDADAATLKDGYWEVTDAWVATGTEQPGHVDEIRIPSDLTIDRIQENFAPPESLSFWDLPDFIENLEATGFSAVPHRLHLQALLAQPLLLASMVLFAAAFSLRYHRRGGTLLMIVGGIVTGLVLFVVNDVVMALGTTEAIPIAMAAWIPAGVGALIGSSVLLHFEDG